MAPPATPITLSLVGHAVCLLAVTLFLSNRMMLPELPGSTQVAMVFEPAPATVPPVPAAPTATPTVVPTPPEPTRPPTAQAPVPPAAPPVPSAAIPPPPSALERLARVTSKADSRPVRTPPVERHAMPRPSSKPAEKLASLTRPPSSVPPEVPSAGVGAARPAATAPLIPPRPVAGMATNRAPAYPAIAQSRDEQGRVMLRVSVSADGKPLQVDVAKTSGYPILDSAAESAVRQWQFIPATRDGTPVAAIAEVPVLFQLEN